MAQTQSDRQEELEEAQTNGRAVYFDYASDARNYAQNADGPFSFRVPNASESALLYATIPDPRRPIEMYTAQDREAVSEQFQAQQRHDPTPEYVRVVELEPEKKHAPEYEYAMGMGQ